MSRVSDPIKVLKDVMSGEGYHSEELILQSTAIYFHIAKFRTE